MKILNSIAIISAVIGISYGRDVSYSELVTLRVDCNPYDTCNTTKDNINATFRNCQCDNSCAIYGDCCLDAEKRPLMERITNRNYKCVKVNDLNSYYMVSICKNNWRDLATRAKCERNSTNDDPFSLIPATSKRSKIIYKNRYCAACNEDGNDLNFWNIGVDCPNPDNAVKLNLRNNLTYNHSAKIWGVRLQNNTFIECKLVLEVPEDKLNLRFCYPNIKSTCSPKWTDNFIREKCESYNAVIEVSNVGDIYRNVHCAICNEISISTIRCPSIDYRKLPGSPNFTDLFNVDKDEDPNSRCKKGEVWDAAFEKCRKLSCGLPFLEFKNGKCVPKS